MFSLGLPELFLIFIVALLVFGPEKLPEIGRTLGKAVREFRKVADTFRSTIDEETGEEDRDQPGPDEER